MLLVSKLLHTFKPNKNESNKLLETGNWHAFAGGVTTEGLRVVLGVNIEIFLPGYSNPPHCSNILPLDISY